MSRCRTMKANKKSRKRKRNETQVLKAEELVLSYAVLLDARKQPGLNGKLVLMHTENVSDASRILKMSAKALDTTTFVDVDVHCKSRLPTYLLRFGNEIIARGYYPDLNYAEAASALFQEVFEELRRFCFTVVRKGRSGFIVGKDGSVRETKPAIRPPIFVCWPGNVKENIGWTKGSLMSREQRFMDLQKQASKAGLGANIMDKISKILADFAQTRSIKSLVFSQKYTKEERKQIQQLANKYDMWSKGFGKGKKRYLVVSCRLDCWYLVEKLIEAGNETDDYKLIYPTDIH